MAQAAFKPPHAGSILLEAAVSILLAGVVLIPLLSTLITEARLTDTSLQTTQALRVATSTMEELRADPQLVLSWARSSPVVRLDPWYHTYTEKIAVQPDPSTPHLYDVRIEVTWTDPDHNTWSVPLAGAAVAP